MGKIQAVDESGIKRGLGWRPGLPNFRLPKLHQNYLLSPKDIEPQYDPRSKWQPCYDQGEIGSCVDNATCGDLDFYLRKTNYPWQFMPSRLFAYYNARAIEGTTDQDAGSTINDGVNSLIKYGVCPESGSDANPAWSWPYDPTQLTVKPPDACYKDAILHCALETQAVPQDSDTITSLLMQDIPVLIGFTVYSDFMSNQTKSTGIMPLPGWLDYVEGGHGVLVVGYLTDQPFGNQGVRDWAIVRNSWGITWGQDGWFLMPWEKILLNAGMASDFQAITKFGLSKPAPVPAV